MTTMWNVAIAPGARAARVDLDLGSGLRLHLDERRIAARAVDAERTVVLTGEAIPDTVIEVIVQGEYDGREIDECFEPAPGLVFTIDGDHPPLAAPIAATLKIGWRFARRGVLPARTRWWDRPLLVSEWDGRSAGLGGFTPTPYHRLEPRTGVMWTGNGRRVNRVDVVSGASRGGHGLGRIPAAADDLLVVSDRSVHVFDPSGRHRHTIDLVRGRSLAAFTHDDEGRLSRWELLGPRAIYEVSRQGPSTLITAPGGQWATIAADDAGRATAIALAQGPTIHVTYGAEGLITSSTGPRDQRVHLEHDEHGALTSWRHDSGRRLDLVVAETAGGTRTSLLTAGGRESSIVEETLVDGSRRQTRRCCGNAAGTVTTRNLLGTTIQHPDGAIERRVSWSDASREGYHTIERATLRTPAGRTSTTVIERIGSSGVHEEITTIDGRRRHRRFDASTGVTTDTAPAGKVDTVILEPHRRMREQRAGRREVITEFEDDMPVRIVDGGRVLTFEHDEHGRLRMVIDGDDRREVHHDATGRVTAMQLARGWLTIAHDEAGDIAAVTVPGGATTRLERTTDGLVSAVHGPEVDGRSACVRYEYDDDRRLVRRSVDGGPTVTFRRNAAGALTGLEAGNLRIEIDIDEATVAATAVRTGAGDSVTWVRDGPLLVRELVDGRVHGCVERVHDNGLWATALRVDNVEFSIERDPGGAISGFGPVRLERSTDDGLVRTVTVGSVVTTRTYDDAARLAGQRTTLDDTLLFEEAITRDDRGRVVAVTETDAEGSRTVTFRYDDGLAASARDGVDELMLEHDDNGNIVGCLRHDRHTSAGYDAADRLTGLDGRPARSGPAGELLDDGERRYRYDPLSRLTGVEALGSPVIEHTYDGLGRLIESTADGSPYLHVLWSGRRPVAVAGRARVRHTCVSSGERAAPEAILAEDRTLRLVTDHRGSVRVVVDAATGEVLQRLDYDALGRRVVDTNPGFQPFGFTGGLHDPYTGLVHLDARVLDPRTGRFLTPDPIGFEGGQTNLYVYAANDPVNRMDPTGTQSEGSGQVTVCTVPFMGSRDTMSIDHVIIKTDDWSRGQGIGNDATAAERAALETEWVDEKTNFSGKDKPDTPGQECRPVENVDEECLDYYTTPGTSLGRYGIGRGGTSNICFDAVFDVLDTCSGPGGWEYGEGNEGPGLVADVYLGWKNIVNASADAIETVVDWVSGD